MGKLIIITSEKGGTGKSMVSALLAQVMAGGNHKVILADLCAFGAQEKLSGMDRKIVYHLQDVLEGSCEAEEALVPSERTSGLYRLFSPRNRLLQTDSLKLRSLFLKLKDMADFVIIDTETTPQWLDASMEAIVYRTIHVLEPNALSLQNYLRVRELYPFKREKREAVIVSRVRKQAVKKGIQYDMYYMKSRISSEILGEVPEDERYASAAADSALELLPLKALKPFYDIAAWLRIEDETSDRTKES